MMIMRGRKPSLGVLSVAASALFAVSIAPAYAAVSTVGCGGSADTCTLAELFGGGSITAGSKTFDAFSLVFEDVPPLGVGNDVDEGVVSLTGLDDAGLVPGPGFRFNGNGELVTPAGELIGYVFEFDVTDNAAPISLIDGASLTAGPFSLGSDDFFIVQARLPNINFAADLEVFAESFSGTSVVASSFDLVPDAASIRVGHSISVDSFLGSGATLTDYTFRVNQTVIPLPMALPLMLSGLGLLAGVARRRSR